jgi:hypothetical protein
LSDALFEATQELAQFKETMTRLKVRDLPKDILKSYTEESSRAAEQLWQIAGRISILKEEDICTPGKVVEEGGWKLPFIQEKKPEAPPPSPLLIALDKQSQRIRALSKSLHEAREALLILVISSNIQTLESSGSQMKLQSLSEAIKELYSEAL